MNELQNRYIGNQILSMPVRVNQELSYAGKEFNKCSDYENITNYIDDFLEGRNINRFLLLPGIRDVGKTTLLFQVYEYLLKEKGISPQNILYFSCDRLKKLGKIDIFEVVSSYSQTYHNSILETLSEPIFILVDEAQNDEYWDLNGKLIFDASQNIFMIFTGSSALKLSYNPDAARRWLNIPIYPLTYSHHLKLKYCDFKNDISEPVVKMIFDGNMEHSKELNRRMFNIYSNFDAFDILEWKNFLQFGGFPSSFFMQRSEITKKIVEVVDKVVTTDMPDIEGIKDDTRYLAFQILNFFAFQNPGEVSKGSLANTFDASKSIITKVLNILEKTQLIFHIEPFTSSTKRTTKPHEYFFATSSLKHNLILSVGNAVGEDENAYMGKLLETYVASSFLNLDERSNIPYKTYYDDSKKKSSEKNVDFIVQRGIDKPIPIEVSYGKKDISQIKRAIRKYHSPHGVIISNTTSDIVKKGDIIFLPPEIFAFM